MAYSQAELGRRFREGAESGTASNVEIEDFGDYTALVGYGWAVYAVRHKESGKVIYFQGWYGYSQSTSCQISKFNLQHAFLRVDTSPQTRVRYESVDVTVGEDLSWGELVEEFVPEEGNRQRVVA